MAPKIRETKKSEMLELRVSLETKETLRLKSLSEGRSVSEIVRGLITDYLADDINSTPNLNYKERAYMLKSLFVTKPKSTLAGICAVFITGISFVPIAFANEIILDFEGEFIKLKKDGSRYTKRVSYEISGDNHENFTLDFDVAGENYSLDIKAVEVSFDNAKDGVLLSFQLKEDKNGEDVVIAMPHLSTVYGEQAVVKIENGEGASYNWKVRPRLGK